MGENYGWFQWKPPQQCRGQYTWRKNAPGFIPPRALPIGRDKDGSKLYAGRALHQGDLLPAKVRADGNKAYVPYGGSEIEVHQFEILASHHIAWQHSHDGEINSQAMIIGHTTSGENLYMGRAFYEGTITPGKVHPTHRCLYIPYNGKEISIKEYEIMLLL
ncbi:natterin-3-like isoform X2 [Macrosteles quadrilineatus]|uniref:natterin-3-like isoform X1 n=1 Tax=Macrosteles quadrilineatus TaxID=74068 RepID=UPI0023E34924|nr:natterin-3-like isoform X1 [Macrosteles quadrilineatus]XP_054257250.1 natterin-3-like isoform X2 [Macrosteles quadrilineatus]XP_054280827.1 natterin-3-like isoform X1 [Macrosteles quadrilineatus]XP_054280828.1 natterin-3-like isoform X2 [Macrosteles quadrilineatus]